jgi:hypothetical protein
MGPLQTEGSRKGSSVLGQVCMDDLTSWVFCAAVTAPVWDEHPVLFLKLVNEWGKGFTGGQKTMQEHQRFAIWIAMGFVVEVKVPNLLNWQMKTPYEILTTTNIIRFFHRWL